MDNDTPNVPDNTPDVETPNPDAEQIKGDVEEQVEKAEEQGFIGTEVDQTPNEEYTLTTGPDSPPHVEDDQTRVAQATASDTTKE